MTSDAQVLAAIRSQVPSNPNGCSAIDALIGLGAYAAVQASLDHLVAAGQLRETSPGQYLPADAEPAA